MDFFTALKIDPYTKTTSIVQFPKIGETDHIDVRHATRLFLASNGGLDESVMCSALHGAPQQHYALFSQHVQAGRVDPVLDSSISALVCTSVIYIQSDFRALMYSRDDLPPPESELGRPIPGFVFLDSMAQGAHWRGVGYMVLYQRKHPRTVQNVDFFTHTISKIVWRTTDESIAVGDPKPKWGIKIDRVAGRVASITPTTGSRCAMCFKMNDTRNRCTRCERCYYCDKACQVAHWPVHKKNCIKIATRGLSQ
jgi:hypothetical protein